ncbi:MAG: DUF1501 domain-containing protein [Planctomycetia bacterium]|nr:DUF1501 domain-containing protein [Planctomycetia bacterium]
MFTLHDNLSRRDWIRVGGIGLGGLTLPRLLKAGPQAPKAKSVIVFGLVGGPAQHETFDPKPNAPAEVRGVFGHVQSRTPGLLVGELLPRTSGLTNKLAVLRAVVTNDNAHSSSGYQMLTGVPHQPMGQESATPKPPNNWPSIGAMLRYLRPDAGRLPSSITIPEHIWNDGNFPWPGQDAGLLGSRHSPWLIPCDPAAREFQSPALTLPDEVPAMRFQGRASLLSQIERHFTKVNQSAVPEGFSVHAKKAMDLLQSTSARRAFDIGSEPVKVRERYGNSRFAQSVLLARRLVEAGVGLVQVNWTRIAGQPNQGGWDTHAKHNDSCKSLLMPIADRCFSALIEDLEVRGLLDETLVIWFGEFGRTPKFNGNGGRDHWGHCFSLALAGGGIKGGVVYGASDKHAAYPVDGVVSGADIIATIFDRLGFGTHTELQDPFGRPFALSRGKVIGAIV